MNCKEADRNSFSKNQINKYPSQNNKRKTISIEGFFAIIEDFS